ncbi:unnamed protein product, partial [Toxocara canis]|uniref:Ras family protein n=1 Tax=Toxocara canis TaxID=6265 RepID=A0A183VDK8_TOXCA
MLSVRESVGVPSMLEKGADISNSGVVWSWGDPQKTAMGIWGKRPLRSAEYHIKVNVVGNSGVGKSSLLMTYFKGYHVPADMPTIYEQYNRMVRYGGWQIALSISDSSGMPLNSVVRRYNYKYTDVFILCYAVDDPNSFAGQIALSISDSSGMPLNSVVRRYNYKYTDVFILCYAVDDPNSFADLPKWAREIRSTVGYVPIVLVALKDDLKGDASIAEKLEWDGESIITFKDGTSVYFHALCTLFDVVKAHHHYHACV